MLSILMAAEESFNLFSFLEAIETLQAIILILGMILLIVEIFTPGFGIAGGSGLVLLILGIVLTARNTFEVMVMVSILIILVVVVILVILRSARRGTLSRKLILWSATSGEDGYQSTADRKSMIGREGLVVTILRPAGTADFGGERLDVVSEGEYIQPGTRIRVVQVEGRRIVVKPVHEGE